MISTYTITTAKGSFSGTLRAVAEWQAEHQGSYADIDGVDVDGVDFDADEMGRTMTDLRAVLGFTF